MVGSVLSLGAGACFDPFAAQLGFCGGSVVAASQVQVHQMRVPYFCYPLGGV